MPTQANARSSRTPRTPPPRRARLTVRPLTADLWPALDDLFGRSGASNGCWCMYWRIGGAYRDRPKEENRADLRSVVLRGPASRPPRLRRRHGGGLVPGDPAPRPPLPGWVHQVRTARRPTGLVGVLLLRPARVPGTGRLLGAARGGHPLRAGGGCARARGLPVDEGPEVVHRPRVHVRARGLPGGRGPKRGSARHAAGASTRGSAASGPARDETNVALSRRSRRGGYLLYRLSTSTALVPPKPKRVAHHRVHADLARLCSARSPDRSPDRAWCS